MKTKILKAILGMILVILGITLLVVAYYLIADIETKVPEGIEETCNLEVKTFIGRHLFILTPKEEKSDKVILYFHGGAYMAEATNDHWEFLENVVNDTKATVIMPDYPLTPKHNYKDVYNMVEPLYKEIVNSVGADNLIVIDKGKVKGIKTANYLNGKIQAAEKEAKNKPEKEKEEEQINPENLAKEIQDDMTR